MNCACGQPAKFKGMCKRCYHRAYRLANLEKLRQRSREAWYRLPKERRERYYECKTTLDFEPVEILEMAFDTDRGELERYAMDLLRTHSRQVM